MRILLVGAGFSRNWGGWLVSELRGELFARLRDFPDVSRRVRNSASFEDALDELQREERTAQEEDALDQLRALERAVSDCFQDMNRQFARAQFEFSNQREFSVTHFLSRFDAIFSLNQDLLLELHYDNSLTNDRRWNGQAFPGVAPPPNWQALETEQKISREWTVDPDGRINVAGQLQPIYKLHGSVNWRTAEGHHLAIFGGNKAQRIREFPLFSAYMDEFERLLNIPNSQLMVIGYSFGDSHINDKILDAAQRSGTGIYLVDPAGEQVLEEYPDAIIRGPNMFDDVPIIGVSLRGIREVFSSHDALQLSSFYRFFG